MALSSCQTTRVDRAAGMDRVDKVDRVLAKLRPAVPPDTCREYRVISSAVPNASMDAHGTLTVSTGLLRFAETDDLLAFAIAHELSHAVLHHPQRLRRAGWLQLLASAAVAWAAHEASDSKTDAALAGGGFFLSTALLGTLPLTRRMEREADLMARDILVRAGYDSRAAADFWQRYAAARPLPPPPLWLSAHPSDAARIRYLRARNGRRNGAADARR